MRSPTAKEISILAILAGCSVAPQNITPAYVSPLQYQTYTCEQIAGEIPRIEERLDQLSTRLDDAATSDKAIAASAILFWQSLFLLGGTGQQEAEYARLKGEHEAIKQSSLDKKCQETASAPIQQPPKPKLAEKAEKAEKCVPTATWDSTAEKMIYTFCKQTTRTH